MFADDFPSVPGRSINQDLIYEAGADIPIEDYLTIDFPPAFKAIYGTPVPYYRAWERLMDITIRPELRLKIKQSFLQFASNTMYPQYCKMIDDVAAIKNLALVGRTEMDAAWVQQLVRLYNLDRKDMNDFLGYRMSYNHVLEDIEDVEKTMKALLERAVARRFDRPRQENRKVEKYWAEKGELASTMGQILDTVCIDDSFLEYQFNPPRDLSLEKDYPTRLDDHQELDTIMEEPEENANIDGGEYDSRSESESESEEEFEFPPEDDSEVDEGEGGGEDSDGDIAMSGAVNQFVLPIR
ncbi:hypothetical protein SBOR_4951 [Sclerotinia borealis F-4128]|uniref:Uncharacterized protein n=1 Tax=Sclerotinia borealis (strain F-4128) TaxID=1432307 RepID=W9CJJ6_SCLBF|nr:hypothetical protein SBOR_4951 [Sclerotinia borealis F-4128]